jgi:hypothetical protein
LDTAGDVVVKHRLEERDMEHRVNTHGRRELEAVGGLADLLHNVERAEALVIQLVARAGGLDVATEQPHLVTFFEVGGLLPLLVVESSLRGRGVGDVERELGLDVAKPLDQIVGGRVGRLGVAGVDGGDGVGMVAAVCKERGLVGRGVNSVVIGELGERKEFLPVVLLVAAEHAQILLEDLVYALCLAISLRMEGRGHVGRDVEEREEVSPEFGVEQPVAIGHNVGWQTVQAVHIPEKQASDVGSVSGGLGRGEVCHLGEAIDDDEDGVVAGGRQRQRDNEVHRDRRPRTRGNGKRHEESMRLVARHLGTGARVARRYIALDKTVDARPVEVARHHLVGLGLSKVAGRRRVMALAKDPEFDRIVIGHVDEAVEAHKVIAEAVA